MKTKVVWSSSTKKTANWAHAAGPTTRTGWAKQTKLPAAYVGQTKNATHWPTFDALEDELGSAVLDEAFDIVTPELGTSATAKSQTAWQ